MARVNTPITAFTSGMLDPGLYGRRDFRAWYSGAQSIRNMLASPLGGVTRRPGLRYLQDLSDAGAGAVLANFEFNDEQIYLIVVTHQTLRVFRDGQLMSTESAPWTGAQLETLTWTQSADTMIFFHADVAPHRLMRQGSHTAWNLATVIFDKEPIYGGGFPRCGVFHEDRLWMGGSRGKPNTLWASVSGDYFSFFEGTAEDDEAIEAALLSDQVNAIKHLVSQRNLAAFTSGRPFAILDRPVTPTSIAAVPQHADSIADVQPVVIEGATVFISGREGQERQSVIEYIWNDVEQAFSAEELSLLSGFLIRGPVDMDCRRANRQNSARHLFIVNGDDGTVACLNSLRSQEVTSWTLLDSLGNAGGDQFMRVAVVGNEVYWLMRRTINGSTRYTLEVWDEDSLLDCSVSQTSGSARTTWSGLGHLEGETVAIRGDGYQVRQVQVVDGAIEIDEPVSSIEVGLPFEWEIRPMPVEAQLQSTGGTIHGLRRRIVSVTLQLQDTQAVSMDGRAIPLRQLGDALLDQPIPVFSGVKKIRRLGWSRDDVPRIHSSVPQPATVLAMTMEVMI